jgi:hypothetical protein
MSARMSLSALAALVLTIGTGGLWPPRAAAQQPAPGQTTFASPEEAVAALSAAVKIHDKAAFHAIFGPGIGDLLTGDEAQDKANSRRFAKAMGEGVRPVSESGDKTTLEIGKNNWPFPIPLVKENSVWRFDTAAGKEEIVNRHIGKDELHAIGVCRSFGGGGPLPKPFHGYLFRIVPGQGPAAPGAMAGGFTLVAYPEHWGRSGIMTFVVKQDGKVYQRDLGEETSRLATTADDFNAGGDWTPVAEQGVIAK